VLASCVNFALVLSPLGGLAKMLKSKALHIVLIAAALIGCHTAATKPKTDVLHVTFARLCSEPDIAGTFDGKTFSLAASRDGRPLYVACFDPIRPEDVGKDFHATWDKVRGQLIVSVPDFGDVHYDISTVGEVKQ
jgi:hypothetical protein